MYGLDSCFNIPDDMNKEQFPLLRNVCLKGFWEDESEIQDLSTSVFDCPGKGDEDASGCCFNHSTPDKDIIVRNTAFHTDTSDDWRHTS